MIRDPSIYLEKAKYFYTISKDNTTTDDLVDTTENELVDAYPEEFINTYQEELVDVYPDDLIDVNSEELTDVYTDEMTEYEYVPVAAINPPIEPSSIYTNLSNIKPSCRRYYDPITKHYFKIDKIFEPDTNINEIDQQAVKNPDIWYPENKLSFKTTIDPLTGKFYRINKVYDANGKYSYRYDELNKNAIKQPGTNYYRPVFK